MKGAALVCIFQVENPWTDFDTNAKPLEATTYSYISVGITDSLDFVPCVVF
jgi:hypothetical protein